MDDPGPQVVVKWFAHCFEELIEAAIAVEPVIPQVILVQANAADEANGSPRKSDEIAGSGIKGGKLVDPPCDDGQDQTTTGSRVALMELIDKTLILWLSGLVGADGQDGTLLYFQAKLFQLRGTDPELGVQQGGLGGVVQLAICDTLGDVGGQGSERVGEVDADKGEGPGEQEAVARGVGCGLAVGGVGVHVVQTRIEVGEHCWEVPVADQVRGAGSVQASGHGLEVRVVAQVLVHVVG